MKMQDTLTWIKATLMNRMLDILGDPLLNIGEKKMGGNDQTKVGVMVIYSNLLTFVDLNFIVIDCKIYYIL